MISVYLLAAGLAQAGAPPPLAGQRDLLQPPAVTEPVFRPRPGAHPAAKPPATRAKADLAGILSDADYPPEAIRKGEQGTVGFRLVVDRRGEVASCEITASSGSAVLDNTTCVIMTSRLHFTPAADAKGRPVGD